MKSYIQNVELIRTIRTFFPGGFDGEAGGARQGAVCSTRLCAWARGRPHGWLRGAGAKGQPHGQGRRCARADGGGAQGPEVARRGQERRHIGPEAGGAARSSDARTRGAAKGGAHCAQRRRRRMHREEEEEEAAAARVEKTI